MDDENLKNIDITDLIAEERVEPLIYFLIEKYGLGYDGIYFDAYNAEIYIYKSSKNPLFGTLSGFIPQIPTFPPDDPKEGLE